MAVNSVKTIYHSLLEQSKAKGVPFTVLDYSTLNEKFSIPLKDPKTDGSYPDIKYFTIGRGGHRLITGAGGSPLIDILQHAPTDAALFEHIPFRLVPVSDDLPSTERVKYRLRVLKTYGGIDYFAYYAKVIDGVPDVTSMTVVELNNGVITSETPYNTTPSNLNPAPVDPSNTIVNTVTGRHILVESTVDVVLTGEEISAIIDAVGIIYNDIRYATISEIGVVSAYDTSYTSNEGGITATYNELQSAQIVNFIGSQTDLQTSPLQLNFKYGFRTFLPYPPLLP